jgi:hypothetical protein
MSMVDGRGISTIDLVHNYCYNAELKSLYQMSPYVSTDIVVSKRLCVEMA